MSVPPFVTLPPGVHSVRIETSRGTFAALEARPGVGVPERCSALMVPGYTGSKEDFIAVLPALAGAGRRVVAIDQRGQYETAGTDDPAVYTGAALGADIAALIAELTHGNADNAVHVVGHSFGGLVVREAVIADPSRVASLTLMSSGPAAIGAGSAERADRLVDALSQGVELQVIWDFALEPEAVAAGVPTEIIAFLHARWLANSRAALRGMGREVVSAPDRVDRLAGVLADASLSALVLFGEDDDGWAPTLQTTMANRLEAGNVVIPGAGHSPAAEAPETTATALTTFWNEAERTGNDSLQPHA